MTKFVDYLMDGRRFTSKKEVENYINVCFRPFLKFLKINSKEPRNYILKSLEKIVNKESSAKEKLFSLFVSSIKSPGNTSLTRIGSGCKQFCHILDFLFESANSNLEFNKFIHKLRENFNSIKGNIPDKNLLFEIFVSKLDGIGNKTASLFIRDLDVIQNHDDPSYKIFDVSSYRESEYKPKLLIPVDRVIASCLSKIFKLEEQRKLNAERDFHMINDWAMSHLKEKQQYMLIEDLWYWGFFNTKIIDKTNVFEFNESKYYSDFYRYPEENGHSKKMLEKFFKLITQGPS